MSWTAWKQCCIFEKATTTQKDIRFEWQMHTHNNNTPVCPIVNHCSPRSIYLAIIIISPIYYVQKNITHCSEVIGWTTIPQYQNQGFSPSLCQLINCYVCVQFFVAQIGSSSLLHTMRWMETSISSSVNCISSSNDTGYSLHFFFSFCCR